MAWPWTVAWDRIGHHTREAGDRIPGIGIGDWGMGWALSGSRKEGRYWSVVVDRRSSRYFHFRTYLVPCREAKGRYVPFSIARGRGLQQMGIERRATNGPARQACLGTYLGSPGGGAGAGRRRQQRRAVPTYLPRQWQQQQYLPRQNLGGIVLHLQR